MSTWRMPCTIPSLCLFSSIFFFLQKSLLLYFCLLKLLSCQGPEQTQACLCSLSRAFPVSTDCPCGLCSLEQDATVCLSFALDRHTDTQTHRLAHPQAQYTCTYIGIAHTHTHTEIHTKYKHIEGSDCILLFWSFQHTQNALDSESIQ